MSNRQLKLAASYLARMRELVALVRWARRDGLASYARMYTGELRGMFKDRHSTRHRI
jgi:hypothetical protein